MNIVIAWKKELAKSKNWKGGLGKNSRPGGLKIERAVQAKIRGIQKKYIPDGLKTQKGGPGKS